MLNSHQCVVSSEDNLRVSTTYPNLLEDVVEVVKAECSVSSAVFVVLSEGPRVSTSVDAVDVVSSSGVTSCDTVKRLVVVASSGSFVLEKHLVDFLSVVLTHFFFENTANVAKSVILVVKEDSSLRHIECVCDGLRLCSNVLENWLGGVR